MLFDVLLQKALSHIKLRCQRSLRDTGTKLIFEDIISHHSHTERDEYASPLLLGTPVAAPRCQKLHKSQARKRKKINCVCSQEGLILRHRHNRRVRHVLLLQFGILVATVRCQKLHKSRQYNRRENAKK